MKPKSISTLLAKDGTGAVEVMDGLLGGSEIPRAEWPCSWVEVTSECRPLLG